jgi:hypothetical protein
MRQLFTRVGYLVITLLLGLVGVTAAAGPAWAEKQANRLVSNVRVQGCASAGCVQDPLVVSSGAAVSTYCVRNGYNVIYTGPATGRGGFVDRARLQSPAAQSQSCDVAGVFASVTVGSVLVRACSSSNCLDTGAAFSGDQTGVFCRLGTSPNRWYLAYVNDTRNAGFLPESALTSVNVPAC